LWEKLILRKIALILRKITWIDHKILSLRKCVLHFPSWELIFSIWVTEILKLYYTLIISSREFRSANETRDERPLVRCVYGCLSLTNVKRCALNLCDCNLQCDLAKWRRARNTKLKKFCSELDILATLPYLEGKFFNLICIYNDTINKHCKNIAKACTSICMYVCVVLSAVKHVPTQS